jgi:putative transcriptional regulator
MAGEDEYDRLLGGLSDALALPEPTGAPDLHPNPLQVFPRPVPTRLDVAAIRRRTGLSQPAFARRIGVSLATLRNWEQGHRSPTGPARVLLALVDRNPLIVQETLAD